MTERARRLLAESPAPRVDVARGFAVTQVEEKLLERFAAEPHTEAVDLGGHVSSLRVLRWRLDPAVAEVAAPEPVGVEGRATRTPSGTLLVDSREGTTSLSFADRGRKLELAIERGHVRLFSLSTEGALPAFEPRVATGGEPISGWLAEHIESLRRSDDPTAPLAAVGALVRFFTPSRPDDPSAGAPQVVRGARGWARSIDDDDWTRLEDAMRERAARLVSAFGELEHMANTGIVEIALERDVIESIAIAARLAGRGDALIESMRAFDREARAHLTSITERVATVDDPRLAHVSWSEPEAWWGTLAR